MEIKSCVMKSDLVKCELTSTCRIFLKDLNERETRSTRPENKLSKSIIFMNIKSYLIEHYYENQKRKIIKNKNK